MTLSDTMHALPEADFPKGLHGRIMRRLVVVQFRIPFLILFAILLVNLGVSGWHLWAKVGETNSISIIESMIDGFEWSADFASNAVQNAIDFLPLASTLVFLVNLIVVAYFAAILVKFQKLQIPNKGRMFA